MYKEASKQKLRIATPRGPLSAEQLWDLPLSELDKVAIDLEEAFNNSKGKSFLDKRTTKDKGLKLQFDLVLDMLRTKQDEQLAAQTLRENKESNERILTLIAEKQDEELKNKPIAELKKLLK